MALLYFCLSVSSVSLSPLSPLGLLCLLTTPLFPYLLISVLSSPCLLILTLLTFISIAGEQTRGVNIFYVSYSQQVLLFIKRSNFAEVVGCSELHFLVWPERHFINEVFSKLLIGWHSANN